MKNIIFSIVIAMLAILCSCSKTKNNDQLPKTPFQVNMPYTPSTTGVPLRRSETLPIVILKPVKPSGLALASSITAINGTDTLVGQTTSNNPEYYLQLTAAGQWLVTIKSQGYKTVNEVMTYVDSSYYQVDTLQTD